VLHDKNNEINNQLKWGKLRTIVKEFSMQYSQQNSYNTKQYLKQLIEAEIEKLELIDSNLIDMKKKKQLETEREEIYQNITKGAYVRSKANWIEKGAKNTPYFLRLERQRNTLKIIQ
jgi:ribosomal protein S20